MCICKAILNSIQYCNLNVCIYLWKLHRLQIRGSVDFAGHGTSKLRSVLKGPCYITCP